MAAGWSLLCRIIDPYVPNHKMSRAAAVSWMQIVTLVAQTHIELRGTSLRRFEFQISTPDMSSNYPDWRMKTRHNNRNVTCRCQRSHHIPHYGIMGGVALNALS
ncbi:uncharacterized protein RAG0_10156 [Rhynchosporium agropyri]|uniref:Uncharacterized protein n=1 Tax=Rhynchosporium agropyri TaxID=914238 RepID=A0A1E1KYP7_9HELO|nr:uncharacterized protein RAG0_10156 [Rhynchosporium agropyri]